MELLKSLNPAKAAGLAAAKAQAAAMAELAAEAREPRGFGWRMLPRFKTVNGKRYQLHATRGWKCVGRAT